MKNTLINKMFMTLAISLLSCGYVKAQLSTTFAKNATPGQQRGVYYALPQTVLRLDFILEETRYEEGRYADFALRYLGTTDYIDESSVEYKILGVNLVNEITADPNATFFVSLGGGRGASNVDLDVDEKGIIRSIGVGTSATDGYVRPESISVAREEEKPVIATTNQIVFPSVGKSEEQTAKEIADKIEEIQKAKFQLVSGFYEVAYAPKTLQVMYDKLDEMERQYMELFMGCRSSRTIVKSVYVIPNKEIATMTIAKFSEEEGLSVGTAGSGRPVTIQTLALNTISNINAPSQSAVESMSYEGKVLYRIPDQANVKVMFSGDVLLEERVMVNQYGVLLMAPVTNTRLIFNTETGQITNLRTQM